jgi:sulfatase maturation enzyme AslB (radical SAM superfamily)
MACIEKIYSVSALVGSGACNGNCSFCAGKYLRSQASNLSTHRAWRRNLAAAIKLSARYGGWSLSLTGSGEPTCDPDDVTEALEIYAACAKQGAFFPNVNLFTNGILFGDKEFADAWLPRWRELGLTNVAVSIHSAFLRGQAEAYGLKSYPSFVDIFDNIRRHVGLRCTLLLRKGGVDNAAKYEDAVCFLRDIGCDNITSWSVGNPDGTRNKFTPSRLGLAGIRMWLRRNAKLCHGHVWGGGVYDWNGAILRITDYVSKHDPKADFVRQLVVFQNGTVAYSWIREGALCMK